MNATTNDKAKARHDAAQARQRALEASRTMPSLWTVEDCYTPTCPGCGSKDVRTWPSSARAYMHCRYACDACGAESLGFPV